MEGSAACPQQRARRPLPEPLRTALVRARKTATVILESAVLDVKSGSEPAFEAAFEQAKDILCAMPGFVSLELARCLEVESRYLLLVRWKTLEDHTVGFRTSPDYQRWKALLHHFYDPFPVVEHYQKVFDTQERSA
jgi:heme-degrading monooxygenase HmoA